MSDSKSGSSWTAPHPPSGTGTNANPNANPNPNPNVNASPNPNPHASPGTGTGTHPAFTAPPVEDDDASHPALGPIGLLLRNPGEVARRCLDEEDLRALTLASLAALILGAAVFGGVVGSFRGGVQIAYGATKVPLAMLAALVVCVPAFHAIAASLGRPWPLRTVIALTVTAAGRAALVLLAFAPVLWLAYDLGLGYHAAALAATLAYVVAGLAALGILLRGLGGAPHKLTTAAAFVMVFLAAAGQTGWMLRPYLVRPRTEEVPFVRAREGGFGDALVVSARSALGVYDRARDVASESVSSERALDDPTAPAQYEHPYSPPDGVYR